MKFIIFTIFIMIATAMAAEKECSPLGQYVNIQLHFLYILYER